jgi:hypothetical protein
MAIFFKRSEPPAQTSRLSPREEIIVTFAAAPFQHLKATSRPEQSVGIFWLLGQKLILDITPLKNAESYSDFLTHRESHIDCWAKLQRSGTVPKDIEYEEPPRGRVVCNVTTHIFTIYADRCILIKKASFNRIVRTMHLPVGEIEIATDGHYKCYVCLAKMLGSSSATEL